MAITVTHTTGKVSIAGAQGGSAALSGTPAVGEHIVIAVGGAALSLVFASSDATDDIGTTYEMVVQSAANNRGISAIFIGKVVSSATPTVGLANDTNATNWFGHFTAFSVSGLDGVDVFDVATSATGSSGTPATGSTATSAVSDSMVVAAMQIRATLNPTTLTVESVSPSWTEASEETNGSGNEPGEMDYRVISSTGTQSCSWTVNQSTTWTCCIAVFSGAAAAATLEQEGFRWREGDGSETTATWTAVQDANITRNLDTPARLRVVVNATNDPASATFQLEYRKTGEGTWLRVDPA